MLARHNLLAMWEEEAFDLEFSEGRLLARNVYVCNSPDSVRFAFSQNHSSFERKSAQMRHALTPLLGDGLFVSDGETWRQRRRIVAPIAHISGMARFAPIMVETAEELSERWSQSADGEIDVLAESAQLTAEIICRTIFGRELGRQHAAQVVQGFSAYQDAVGQLDIVSLLGLPDWIPRFHGYRVRRAIKRIHGVLDQIIESQRTIGTQSNEAMVRQLLDARNEDGERLGPEAVRNEAAVLFMAGHETTANTLAWVWYLLAQSPDVAARMHAELDDVVGSRSPCLDDVDRLVYMRAVIDETLRLYPPVPVLARECLTEERYEGYRIPRGSLVMVVPWLLHRHRKFWSEPDRFIPERFLAGSGEPVSKFAYVPFSIGPRICLGMSFAIVEAMLCLATLARRFRLELRSGHNVEPVSRLTLRPGARLPMTIRMRPPRTNLSRPRILPTYRPVGPECPFGHE